MDEDVALHRTSRTDLREIATELIEVEHKQMVLKTTSNTRDIDLAINPLFLQMLLGSKATVHQDYRGIIRSTRNDHFMSSFDDLGRSCERGDRSVGLVGVGRREIEGGGFNADGGPGIFVVLGGGARFENDASDVGVV